MLPSELKHARAWLIANGLDLVDVANLDYNEVSHLIELNYEGGLCGFIQSHVAELVTSY